MPSGGLNLAQPVSIRAPRRAGAPHRPTANCFSASVGVDRTKTVRNERVKSARDAHHLHCSHCFMICSIAKCQFAFFCSSLQALQEQAMLRQPTIVITPPNSTCSEMSSTESDNEIAEQMNTATLDDRGGRKRQCRCVNTKE